jgi:hypothetical protein
MDTHTHTNDCKGTRLITARNTNKVLGNSVEGRSLLTKGVGNIHVIFAFTLIFLKKYFV